MSIELPLTGALAILPLYHGERDPQKCRQITFQTRSAGSAKLNQKICTSVFPRKIVLNNLEGWFIGSSHLHSWLQFGCRDSAVKAAAAAGGYSVSDGSSDTDRAGKSTEMLKLSMNLPDEGKEIQELEFGGTGGSDFRDGGGQRGNGGGDDGKGNNNRRDHAGSEGSDGLLRSEWWWWWWLWQCAQKVRCSETDKRARCGHSLCLANSVIEMVAAEIVKSLQLALAPIAELLSQLELDLDEIISFVMVVPFLFSCLLSGMPHDFARVWSMSMGAILALFVLVPLAAISGFFLWWNGDQQDDNIRNDVEDDNDDM